MTDPAPPQRYRLHIFDGAYEVLHKRIFIVTLDLTLPGYEGILDRHLQALTRAALAAHEPMSAPRLEVRDAVTGALVLDWSGA
ncbi:hypothetical protein GA0074692_6851 [Micromonospora pallida]|uniref:Uncharacterized protein n=1 Tax=Micromonospora pallida TaxID=145854 RepID=A0A1C6TKA6_9ACTN|nr:hypothetical protein [Micromonospora pallida]SCL42179.1 hypothetical protein GA0074692_6696 [Micromonospora pallida]SCL43377.1 hypothetical protein GA0074692_6851 [Micromonospora pallida]